MSSMGWMLTTICLMICCFGKSNEYRQSRMKLRYWPRLFDAVRYDSKYPVSASDVHAGFMRCNERRSASNPNHFSSSFCAEDRVRNPMRGQRGYGVGFMENSEEIIVYEWALRKYANGTHEIHTSAYHVSPPDPTVSYAMQRMGLK